MAIQTLNPFTNKVMKSYEEMPPAVVLALISLADDEALQHWKQTSG